MENPSSASRRRGWIFRGSLPTGSSARQDLPVAGDDVTGVLVKLGGRMPTRRGPAQFAGDRLCVEGHGAAAGPLASRLPGAGGYDSVADVEGHRRNRRRRAHDAGHHRLFRCRRQVGEVAISSRVSVPGVVTMPSTPVADGSAGSLWAPTDFRGATPQRHVAAPRR